MIHAFRTIEIPIGLKDGETLDVRVPFTVELLHRVEETVQRTDGRVWFVLKRSEKSIIQAFEDFCRPYLPEDLDYAQADPTFAALFFSSVKEELLRSINDCITSTTSTSEQGSTTAEGKKQDGASDSSTE